MHLFVSLLRYRVLSHFNGSSQAPLMSNLPDRQLVAAFVVQVTELEKRELQGEHAEVAVLA